MFSLSFLYGKLKVWDSFSLGITFFILYEGAGRINECLSCFLTENAAFGLLNLRHFL